MRARIVLHPDKREREREMREETRAEEGGGGGGASSSSSESEMSSGSVRVFRRGASAIGEETLNDDIVERVV